MSSTNADKGGVRKCEEGGLGWLKERQNSNYFIIAWHDSSNIKVVLCAVCLSVEQMSSPPGEQTATLSLRWGCISVFRSRLLTHIFLLLSRPPF